MSLRLKDIVFCSAFAVIVTCIFWFYLPHVLYYHEQHTLFLYTTDYLKFELDKPSGAVDVLSDFVIQFAYYIPLGALVMGLLMGSIAYLTLSIGRKIRNEPNLLLYAVALLLPMLLVWEMCTVSFKLWSTSAIFLNLLYVRAVLCLDNRYARYIVALVISPAVFAVVGIGYLYYISTIVMVMLLEKRLSWILRISVLIAFIASVYVIPDFVTTIYQTSMHKAYLIGCNISQDFVWIVTGITALSMLVARFTPAKIRSSRITCGVILVITGTVFGLGLKSNFNAKERLYIDLQKSINNQQWQRLIDIAKRYKASDRIVTFSANLAMLQKGSMGEELFCFPYQRGKEGLHFNHRHEYGTHIHAAYGSYNQAIQQMTDLWTQFDNAPYMVQALVDYYVASNRLEGAKKFQNILNGSLFYGKSQEQWEQYVIQVGENSVKPLALPVDIERLTFANFNDIGIDLLVICRNDSLARKPFELMASYMLIHKCTSEFVKWVDYAKRIYGEKLPSLYEQAIVLYQQTDASVDSYTVSAPTVELFREYQATKKSGDQQKLQNLFGTTYWYHVDFSEGAPTSEDIKPKLETQS